MGGACSSYGRQEKCLQGFGEEGGTEGKRTLARYRRRWEDNNDNGYSRSGRVKHGLDQAGLG